MEITKEKRNIVVLLTGAPVPPTPYHRVRSVTASGASVDNDTFTLTCHQWVLGFRW
ncbi:MAG: hypothetical protein F6K31_22905 [Symploca sp. SIO2G7]|nr:hypothetical protein [Symploca sp. SIO2G7]